MSDQQFQARYGYSPPPGMLLQFSRIIPPFWLDCLSPTNIAIPNKTLFVCDGKGEWVDLHSLSAKQLYAIFEYSRPQSYTCAARWMRAYDGDLPFQPGPNWEKRNLLPYQISCEVQLQSFSFRLMYRIIPCRIYHARINIIDSENCTRCAAYR